MGKAITAPLELKPLLLLFQILLPLTPRPPPPARPTGRPPTSQRWSQPRLDKYGRVAAAH